MKVNKLDLGRLVNPKQILMASGDCITISQGAATQLANAGIIAGVAFLSTLSGSAITDTGNGMKALISASIAGGMAFFTSLSLQRGLNKTPQGDPSTQGTGTPSTT